MIQDATSRPGDSARRALVVGHLSTVGDIEVLDWVTEQLDRLGVPHDVGAYAWKLRSADPRWVDGHAVDPRRYTHLIIVCGPFDPLNFEREIDLFARFSHCRWVGVNLSMVEPLERFNPFDVLLERDSDRLVRPDLSLVRKPDHVPVLGLCLAGRQPEYGLRQMHGLARRKLLALAERASAAVLELDTKWPASRNQFGLRSPSEFESVCARVDVLLTTRLHGLVIALKNGVPVIALDAIRGGGKVLQQARALGWAEAFAADTVSDGELSAALGRCLSPEARARAAASVEGARESLTGFEAEFAAALDGKPGARTLPPAASIRLRRLRRLASEGMKRLRARRRRA